MSAAPILSSEASPSARESESEDLVLGRHLVAWCGKPEFLAAIRGLAVATWPERSDEAALGALMRLLVSTGGGMVWRRDLRPALAAAIRPTIRPGPRQEWVSITGAGAVRRFALAVGLDLLTFGTRMRDIRDRSLSALSRLIDAEGLALAHAVRRTSVPEGRALRAASKERLPIAVLNHSADRWLGIRGPGCPLGPFWCLVDDDGIHRREPMPLEEIRTAIGPQM